MANSLLTRIAKLLSAGNIPYMIIGGQAVLLYGEPRLTKDIDITLGVNVNRLSDIIKIGEMLGLRILVENVSDFVNKTMVLPLYDEVSGLRVDMIFSFTDYENIALNRSVNINIAGTGVKFAALEDVIVHKIFAGRPIDLEDVSNIIHKNPDYDKKYVLTWLGTLGEGLKEDLIRRFNSCIK